MSARLWLVLTLTLLGCQSRLNPDAGRKYRCDREAGAVSSQCPDGWRCGFSGYCHANDEPGARACEVPEDCAPTWRCGLDHSCHDPAVAGDYLCETSDDCEQGWHCGVAGRCYQRSEAGAVPCRYDAGVEDCADTWRCGLELICHPQSQGAAYLCLTDEHCEKGWRCDPVKGTCVDATTEGLPMRAAPPSERVSPRTPWSTTDIASSSPFTHPINAQGDQCTLTQSIALASPAGLTQLIHFACGGEPQRTDQFTTPLASEAKSVEAIEASVFALDSQGVLQLRNAGDGGQRRLPFPSVGVQNLIAIPRLEGNDGVYPPLLFAVGSDGYAVWSPDGDKMSARLALPAGTSGARALQGVTEVNTIDSAAPDVALLIAATDDGLFAAARTPTGFASPDGGLAGAWKPLKPPGFGNSACGATGPRNFKRVDSLYNYGNLIALVPAADGGTQDDLYAFEVDTSAAVQTCDTALLTRKGGPCRPCPPGHTLVELHADSYSSYPASSRCRGPGPDGGIREQSWSWYINGTDACELVDNTDIPDDERITSGGLRTVATRSPVQATRIDEHGRIFSETRYTAQMTQAPRLVVGGGGSKVVAFTPEVQAPVFNGTLSPRLFELGTARFNWLDVDPSMLAYLQVCGAVRNAPGWVLRTAVGVATNGAPEAGAPRVQVLRLNDAIPRSGADFYDVSDTLPLAALSQTEQLVPSACWGDAEPSLHAARARTRDGGTALVVVGGDSLWGGELPAFQPDGGAPVPLELKLSPLPRGKVTAVAPITVPGGSEEVLAGYLLAQRRVFRFSSLDDVQWRADEIRMPVGSALDVWADGPSGRVGYDDGRVYSLPSRAPLSPVFEGAGKVLQYASVCGQIYALRPEGLYRLTAGSAVGTWERLTLDLAPAGSDPGYAGARIYAAGNELYVFNRYGTSVRLKDPSCN